MACIPQDAKIDQQWIDLNISFCRNICLCNYCGSYYGCCLTMHISFTLCCALKYDYIFILVYCNTEFWSLSLQINCLVTKRAKNFQFWTSRFLNWDSMVAQDCHSLRTADAFPVVASLPPKIEKPRLEMHLLFAGQDCHCKKNPCLDNLCVNLPFISFFFFLFTIFSFSFHFVLFFLPFCF